MISAGHARPDADRRSHGETGEMAILFGFPAPKSVLMVFASKALAGLAHRTGGAEQIGLGFTTGPGLGALGLGGKEQLGAALAYGVLAPIVTGRKERDENLCR